MAENQLADSSLMGHCCHGDRVRRIDLLRYGSRDAAVTLVYQGLRQGILCQRSSIPI
jgi:hypothetical protein